MRPLSFLLLQRLRTAIPTPHRKAIGPHRPNGTASACSGLLSLPIHSLPGISRDSPFPFPQNTPPVPLTISTPQRRRFSIPAPPPQHSPFAGLRQQKREPRKVPVNKKKNSHPCHISQHTPFARPSLIAPHPQSSRHFPRQPFSVPAKHSARAPYDFHTAAPPIFNSRTAAAALPLRRTPATKTGTSKGPRKQEKEQSPMPHIAAYSVRATIPYRSPSTVFPAFPATALFRSRKTLRPCPLRFPHRSAADFQFPHRRRSTPPSPDSGNKNGNLERSP